MPAFVVKKTDHATYPPSATTAHSAAPQVEGSNPPSKSPEPATPLPLNKPEPRSPVPSPSVPIPALHPQGEGVEHPHPHPSPPRPRIPACPAGLIKKDCVGMYWPTPEFGPPGPLFCTKAPELSASGPALFKASSPNPKRPISPAGFKGIAVGFGISDDLSMPQGKKTPPRQRPRSAGDSNL